MAETKTLNSAGNVLGHIPAYGGIGVVGNATETTIAGTGVANKVQFVLFDTNLVSNGATPDHTNDHITIDLAGTYELHCSISASSVGGTSYAMGLELWKNNGATLLTGAHSDRAFSGGGGDVGSIHVHTQIALAATDTIEFWVYNNTNTNNIVIQDATLTLKLIDD